MSTLPISVSTLVTQPVNAAAGLAIIVAGVPAFLYWSRRGVADPA